ncbi:FHA domain-containing protein [Actinomycetospora endophytica]|uniref:FHA domain-containing protein n=1 Tax=Actinomycetospora endophytica TaxID=2291215 RepID=A0ABS8P918_9PSEU|nr:PqqD family peptide modification chaperone [Actinomycetospora endophytica]MCD2194777.1 FHA domain-containing protein [Actinomycetospora endophytica]
MLCRACHVHVRRDFPYCLRCGTLRKGASVAAFDAPILTWGDQRVPLQAATITIGREPDNDVVVDHPSVSRHHARITRTAEGFAVADLGSSNGTAVTPLGGRERELGSGETATLADATTIAVGDVDVRFEQPRSAAIGSRTQLRGTEHTMLGVAPAAGPDDAPTATEPLDARPRRRSGWALKDVPGNQGQWVLRSTRTNQYLTLDERDVFLWERLDGENSMRDLLFAYLEEYGELALPRIESTVRSFADAGLVRGLPGDVEEVGMWRRLGRALVKNLIRVELSIKGLDPFVERVYHRVGWRLFTPIAVFLLWILTLGGLVAFVRAGSERPLFDFGGAGWIGAVATFAGYLVATALHEGAHALAVKSYGRRVNRGGFLLMMGMPFAFVDTSDMWFGTSWSRIVVAVSGPLTTTGLAGAASVAAITVPDPRAAGICYTLAAGLYVNTLFNLIPLVPLDGYQALADALRTPRLKEEAKEYFSGGFLRDLRSRRRPGAKQIGLVVFAVASMICLYGMLAMSVMTWNSRVGGLLRANVPQPWLTLVVVAVVAVVIFPVWYPRARTLVRRWREGRSRRKEAPAEPATQAA